MMNDVLIYSQSFSLMTISVLMMIQSMHFSCHALDLINSAIVEFTSTCNFKKGISCLILTNQQNECVKQRTLFQKIKHARKHLMCEIDA